MISKFWDYFVLCWWNSNIYHVYLLQLYHLQASDRPVVYHVPLYTIPNTHYLLEFLTTYYYCKQAHFLLNYTSLTYMNWNNFSHPVLLFINWLINNYTTSKTVKCIFFRTDKVVQHDVHLFQKMRSHASPPVRCLLQSHISIVVNQFVLTVSNPSLCVHPLSVVSRT